MKAATLLLALSLLAAPPAAADAEVERVRELLATDRLTPDLIAWVRGHGEVVRRVLDDGALWPSEPEGLTTLSLPGPRGEAVSVSLRVPAGYRTDRAWPLVVALHGTHGTGRAQVQHALGWLGERADQCLIAGPDTVCPGGFSSEAHEIAQTLALLAALGPRCRVDRDRVLLTGYSKGGHGSFVTTALYGDWLAGSMPMAGTFLLTPFWSTHVPLVLPNLAHRPTWVVYGAKDTEAEGPVSRGKDAIRGIAAVNRKVAEMVASGKRSAPGLASVVFRELPDKGHGDVLPPPEVIEAWWSSRRPAPGAVASRSQRFRYPSESWLDGVRVTRLDGPSFDPRAKIALSPRAGQSGNDALREHLDRQIGMLSVRWNAASNALEIRCRRAAALEVWLGAQPLDLSRAVRISLNGRTVHEGPVPSDPLQLVWWRRLTGDAARPPQARLEIDVARGAVVVNSAGEPHPLIDDLK